MDESDPISSTPPSPRPIAQSEAGTSTSQQPSSSPTATSVPAPPASVAQRGRVKWLGLIDDESLPQASNPGEASKPKVLRDATLGQGQSSWNKASQAKAPILATTTMEGNGGQKDSISGQARSGSIAGRTGFSGRLSLPNSEGVGSAAKSPAPFAADQGRTIIARAVPLPSVNSVHDPEATSYFDGVLQGRSADGAMTPGMDLITPMSTAPSTPNPDLWIPEGETDGLPRSERRTRRHFAREAAKLVAAYKAKTDGPSDDIVSDQEGRSRFGFGGPLTPSLFAHGRRKQSSQPAASTSRAATGVDAFELSNALEAGRTDTSWLDRLRSKVSTSSGDGDEVPEKYSSRGSKVSFGGGILSSLLRLNQSEATDAATTPGPATRRPQQESPQHLSEKPSLPRTRSAPEDLPTLAEPSYPPPSAQHVHGTAPLPLSGVSSEQASGRRSFDHRRKHSLPRAVEQGFGLLDQTVKRLADGVGLSTDDRPEAARSSAGVFGALHATAVGLAGPAAPSATNVAPLPTTPGFKLSRYSATPAEPTVTKIIAPKFSEKTLREKRSWDDDTTKSASPSGETTMSPTPAVQNTSKSDSAGRPGLQRSRHSASHVSLASLGDMLNPRRLSTYAQSFGGKGGSTSAPGTPSPEYETPGGDRARKKRRERRRQQEIFITMHVAAVLQRQDFILRFARASMMLGAPSHRLEAHIQSTARVLEIECQVIFLLNFMIISFQDADVHVSEIRFIKQPQGLNLSKLSKLTRIHYGVVHDKIGVQEASSQLSELMKEQVMYGQLASILVGCLCSVFISIASFGASFIDIFPAGALGGGLVIAQVYLASRSDVLSNVFEILVTAIASFVAAALASTYQFCYAPIISSAIVLLLPGWLVCSAGLELQSKSIVAGSVRLVWAIAYSIFLGYGISIGAAFWELFSGNTVVTGPDGGCPAPIHDESVWWRQNIPAWWDFIAVPGFALMLALRNQMSYKSKELPIMVIFASAGWTANHFASKGFPARSDISAGLGSLAVGLLGHAYGKLTKGGNSFMIIVPGVMLQLPSGLGNGGLLNFASQSVSSRNAAFGSGFDVALQLVQVSVGLVVGLFLASVIAYPLGKRRGGLMSF